MKQETKELIDWIVKQIYLAKENCIDPAHKDGYPEYKADWNKAMDFLHSLPEIESKLCRGGYIQDKNGTPCCENDRIIFTVCQNYYDKEYAGKTIGGSLAWNIQSKSFHIITRRKDFEFIDIFNQEFTKFEKVEAVEWQR